MNHLRGQTPRETSSSWTPPPITRSISNKEMRWNPTNHKLMKALQKKRENKEQKWKDPCFKKTNEPPKRANHKGNIKIPNPFMSPKAYQTSKGVFSPQDRQTLSVAHNLESWDMSTVLWVAYGMVIIICHSPCVMKRKDLMANITASWKEHFSFEWKFKSYLESCNLTTTTTTSKKGAFGMI
jgi:hypothetical protein